MTPNRWCRYSAASFSKLSGYVKLFRRKMGRSASTGGRVLRTMVAGAGAGTTAAVTLAGAPGSVTTTSSPGSVGRFFEAVRVCPFGPPQDGPVRIDRRKSFAHDGSGRRRRDNRGRHLGRRARQRDNHIVTRFGGTQHRRQGNARARVRLATAVGIGGAFGLILAPNQPACQGRQCNEPEISHRIPL